MPAEWDRPVVIVSNRGPLSYSVVDGELVGRRGGGGLVSGLAPLVEEGRATWIAAALSDGDRIAARQGVTSADGLSAQLLDLDPEDHRLAYDVISNETLWFVHHGLFDLTRTPAYDDSWWDAWTAYRRVNERFAHAVVTLAPTGAVVLVQDYHLTLLAPIVRAERPDLSLVHFHHTPFAGPDGLRVLPPAARDEMLSSLALHDACGFHTAHWATNFDDVLRRWPPAQIRARVHASSLSSDADALRETAASPACRAASTVIDTAVGDRQLIVRVDRMELSKNIARGFDAYDLLLEQRPDLRGRVDFLACCYPSRGGVPAYSRYRDEVEAAAARVNERWGTEEWQPVRLETDDDYPRSVAALRRYDVLMVNPVRDGLNLVAKEGPLVNEHDGQVVLSSEAGAIAELAGAVDEVHPFDLCATAAALGSALDRGPDERRTRAAWLRELVAARTPADWLADQMAAAAPCPPPPVGAIGPECVGDQPSRCGDQPVVVVVTAPLPDDVAPPDEVPDPDPDDPAVVVVVTEPAPDPSIVFCTSVANTTATSVLAGNSAGSRASCVPSGSGWTELMSSPNRSATAAASPSKPGA